MGQKSCAHQAEDRRMIIYGVVCPQGLCLECVFQAGVEEARDFGFVEISTDKHNFLHAVAVGFVPIAA